MLEYDELRIRIWKTGHRRYLVFANGASSAAAVVTLEEAPETFRERFDRLLLDELKRTTGDAAGHGLRELGRQLFRRLFPPSIYNCFEECFKSAVDKNCGLRVSFEVSPDLINVPFEALCAPATNPFGELALRATVSPVRSLPGAPLGRPRQPQRTASHSSLPLLIVASSKPSDDLDVAGEIASVQAALPPHLTLASPGPLNILGGSADGRPVTQEHIQELFNAQADTPCAALIIAHGEPGGGRDGIKIVFEDEDEGVVRIPGNILAGLLGQARGLRLVVLNLCLGARCVHGEPFSGLAGALIASGVPAVVAMQSYVGDQAASKFSPALFKALYANHTIDEAVSVARRAMAPTQETTIEWSNPALYLHNDYGYGWLFKVTEALDANQALVDPLREYDEALIRISQAPTIQDFERVTPFLRRSKDWQKVLTFASFLQPKRPHNPEYRRFCEEARAEGRMNELQDICEALANEKDPAQAKRTLATMRELARSNVYACLQKEIKWAQRIYDHYQDAVAAEKVGQWQTVLDSLEELPAEYARVARLRAKARGELAVAGGEWQNAHENFTELQTLGVKEAAVDLEYIQARMAEGRAETATGPEGEKQWRAVKSRYQELKTADKEYRDVAARERYSKCRVEESQGEWEQARVLYRRLKLPDFKKLKERRQYALARFAESREWWRWAEKLYAGMSAEPQAEPPGHPAEVSGAQQNHDLYEDAARRLLYVRGRLAETRGDWQGVIDAFGTLGDQDFDWQVGLRRSHARGRLLEEKVVRHKATWDEVGEALQELLDRVPERHRQGDAVLLWNYAVGRSAAERGLWDAAVENFKSTTDEYRDVALRLPYAQGRAAEVRAEEAEAATRGQSEESRL